MESFMRGFENFLKIVRDYGMSTVLFGAGIYAFLMVINADVSNENNLIIASVLTVLGLFSQLWIYSRENPRQHNNEISDQLERMTKIVEKIIVNK